MKDLSPLSDRQLAEHIAETTERTQSRLNFLIVFLIGMGLIFLIAWILV